MIVGFETRRIEFDDDMVMVYAGDELIYKGIEDYEPMNRENWVWDSYIKGYKYGNYTKYCLDV